MSERPVRVVVDELVLYGFSPAQRAAIVDAVQRELAGLTGWSPPPGQVARLDAGAVTVTPTTTPTTLAAGVAGRVRAAVLASTPSLAPARGEAPR